MTIGLCVPTVPREFRTQEGFIFCYRIPYSMNQLKCSIFALVILLTSLPMAGLFQEDSGLNFNYENFSTEIPEQIDSLRDSRPWWETTTRDMDRNGVVDWLDSFNSIYPVGISYSRPLIDSDIVSLNNIGIEIRFNIPAIDSVLVGYATPEQQQLISELPGVVMVEPYERLQFYGDVQTPNIKARNSSEYPVGAWDLNVTGKGVNVAVVDTGIDNEHPGLEGKFVAGFDAVCSDDPLCVASFQPDDGSFDPDDMNQHGTACSGMATSTGIMPDGSDSNFTGSAPDAKLVDVRIGTALGAGPFETYILEQEFYESAMNGLQWVIDNKDAEWAGVENESFGIDIISLSWGITSHENGGSDGSDMHSRILDEATEAGVVVSVAAGNSGSDNDGLSGMGSSSLSITVGATNDKNTIDREDDEIASYSSRGPRRDNGDDYPYDEMKPDVSASGTSIIQSEACTDFPRCDASGNGYTSRGSGTSYATPAVSGVIALMLEANPDLNPLQVREILRTTAERRETLSASDGEGVEDGPWATYPDIDPYWNRHFGWGMVDALAAVEEAILLEDPENVDVELQVYITDTIIDGDNVIVSGFSMARTGSIDKIEYSLDGSSWSEVLYEENQVTPLPARSYINWSLPLSKTDFSFSGEHAFFVRAVSGDMHSLTPHVHFDANGAPSSSSSERNIVLFLSLGVLGALIITVAAYSQGVIAPKGLDSFNTPKAKSLLGSASSSLSGLKDKMKKTHRYGDEEDEIQEGELVK